MFYTSSVTRLGDFWKFLATNFAKQVYQIFDNFLGNYKSVTFKV